METSEQKIRRVAEEINNILLKNKMSMTPTISLNIMPEQPHIITPTDLNDMIGTI